jgi:sterol desaturase/sphingolipid hydroxylase (fatty acid hydroxylase superfamily)
MGWVRSVGPVFWAFFTVTFLAIAIWESWRPKRALALVTERRWANHGILLGLTLIASAIVVRVGPVVMAAMVADSRFGVLNRSWLPFPIRCIAAILILDFAHYWTHWCFHNVSFLWRVHEVHHSDPDYDVSTGLRFHPIETIAVQGATLALVALLAPPPLAVLIAELLAVGINLLVHANVSLPGRAENLMRTTFVTPDFHRIHHSEEVAEQSMNFGQTFSWWDRLFGSFLAEAAKENFRTGLKEMQNGDTAGVWFMLSEPFRTKADVQSARAAEAGSGD